MNINVLMPATIQPNKETIFDLSNKVRRGWVMCLTNEDIRIEGSGKLVARIASYPREKRFELYGTIDQLVRDEYVAMLETRSIQVKKADGYSDHAVAGRRIMKKEYQVDTDQILCQAIEIAMSKLEIEYFDEMAA